MEMRGLEIFNHFTRAAGPSLLKLGHETKWRRFGAIYEILLGQKVKDLTESKNFFAEVFQITSRFVFVKKKIGGLGAL